MSGNACPCGHTNCATYTSTLASTPVIRHVSTIARGTFRDGSFASSVSVDIPSNPI